MTRVHQALERARLLGATEARPEWTVIGTQDSSDALRHWDSHERPLSDRPVLGPPLPSVERPKADGSDAERFKAPAERGAGSPERPAVATRLDAAATCQECGGDSEANALAAWIRKVLALLRIRGRCATCGRSAAGGRNGRFSPVHHVDVFQTFLPASDHRAFPELMRELAEAEVELGRTIVPSSASGRQQTE